MDDSSARPPSAPPAAQTPAAGCGTSALPLPPPARRGEEGQDALAAPPATHAEKTSWILMAASLWFILYFKLVPALVAALVVYSLIHALAAQIAGRLFSHSRAKILAVSLIVLCIIAASASATVLLVGFARGQLGDLPELLKKMAAIIDNARERLGMEPAEDSKGLLANGLRSHSQQLQQLGSEVGRTLINALLGIVIGAMAAFETRRPATPLSLALFERLRRLEASFEKVVFAQVQISALNTALTAAFLLVALPLFGVELPMRKTLVGFTFIVGLIPIIGNLVSNAAIIIMALDVSSGAAVASLVFLVVVHKLQYFLNARIVGVQIRASAWEILLVMLCFEVAFGIPGMIMAPIIYAYTKAELAERALI